MNRKIDLEPFRGFVSSFPSKKNCANTIGISRSHLDGMISGRISMGDKTQKKLITILGVEKLEELLLPEEMIIGKKKVEEIIIKRKKDDELILCLNSRDLIIHKDFEVLCVPQGNLA